MSESVPEIESVLMERVGDGLQVTYSLAWELLPVRAEWLNYWVVTCDLTGNAMKHWGVRFSAVGEPKAWVFDVGSSTQANYDAASVTAEGGSLVVLYRDATLDTAKGVKVWAVSTVENRDAQDGVPVTLLL